MGDKYIIRWTQHNLEGYVRPENGEGWDTWAEARSRKKVLEREHLGREFFIVTVEESLRDLK